MKLRKLDMIDLWLLSILSHDKKMSDAAKIMGLSAPSITARVHKIEKVIGPIMHRDTRSRGLTTLGALAAASAADCIDILERL